MTQNLEGTAEPEQARASGPHPSEEDRLRWIRQSRRGKMAQTLDHLLRIARREARRRDSSLLDRLKWVNSICYITQTYNSLLRDTDYDELKEEMAVLQKKVHKLSKSKHQRPQTGSGTS